MSILYLQAHPCQCRSPETTILLNAQHARPAATRLMRLATGNAPITNRTKAAISKMVLSIKNSSVVTLFRRTFRRVIACLPVPEMRHKPSERAASGIQRRWHCEPVIGVCCLKQREHDD